MTTTARALLVILLLGGIGTAGRAQLPDSPTGRRGNALIAALEGGEEAITTALVEQNFSGTYLAEHPIAETLERLRALVAELAPILLEGAEKTGPFSVVLSGSSSVTGQQVRIHYDIEPEEPHRITRLDVELSEALEPLDPAELPLAADEYLSRLERQGAFSGVALVARGEEVLFEKAYGLANRRWGVANRIDTAFNLGSIDKIFTKVALAQLAVAGRLSLRDTVAAHLPDYPNPEVAGKITLQQLATHTAGLGDIFGEEFTRTSKKTYRRPRDYFPLFAMGPLLFEPGQGQRYSNGGYIVLGAIIEAVSGRSYHDYVRENVFEPAGMRSTRPWALDDPTAPIATGYTEQGPDHEPAPLHENTFHIPYRSTPAGGGYSTARDLLAFRHALIGNALLDARYTEWLTTERLPESVPEGPRPLGIGIAGGGPGVNAALEIDGDWTVVVLANLDPPSAGDAARKLRELVRAVERHEER